ncbi:hypothetical protein LOD99_10172 [Oopsacas minuta]|uniref:Uncharacterized protein n=1 Tax=Oopsacas minuta TaxID=111878 RepID=A0AAV7KK38_9METZ|nr:hypothetical protein LOD99_10172 [Oopsacas minuta]
MDNKPLRVDSSLFPNSASLLEAGGDLPSPNFEILPAYRLKKSQIGAYMSATTTPFQAPLPFMSLTAPSMNPPLTQYYPVPVQPRPVYIPDALRPVWM